MTMRVTRGLYPPPLPRQPRPRPASADRLTWTLRRPGRYSWALLAALLTTALVLDGGILALAVMTALWVAWLVTLT